jgi:beta-glucosidase
MSDVPEHLRAMVATLTLEQKVELVAGADFWTTVPMPSIGLRAIVLSDGPAGVRGPIWDERSPSLNMPSGTALAASWDPALAYRYGVVSAAEARRKGVDVVLGPTINLHRSPLGGRHFECFSEDPLLSGVLGAAYVRGLQDNGVAATPKHYVANDSETDRFTVDIRVEERALRELYLLPFEMAVEAGAWAVMSAYNSIDGVTMTENDLLAEPLGGEWGFDGVVISDWTAVRSLEAARADQDLAMPGPSTAWGDALVAAVRAGEVGEELVDRKVGRLLLLAERVGALGSGPAAPSEVDGRAFAREAAGAGTVLLANRAELPWTLDEIGSIAVIGQNADLFRTQGGGSATVVPDAVVSPLDGIRAALPNARLHYEVGAIVHEGVVGLPLDRLTDPHTGEPGAHVTFVGRDGDVLLSESRRSTALVWFGGDVPLAESSTIVIETRYASTDDEVMRLGFATSKHGRVYVDGELVIDDQPVVVGTDLGAALLAPPSITADVRLSAGDVLSIRAEFDVDASNDPLAGAAAVTLGAAPNAVDPDELIARAVAAARDSDVALVVVGTNAVVESEGADRSTLELPGRQDDLVRAVAAANPRTVVVVNAGAPVLLPWRNEVAAVILGYFGGQEFGSALADVVFGEVEPGGRLTTTWPAAISDVPVIEVVPTDGALDYVEGIHIGYRAWLAADAAPAYPFGWGLGYTTWALSTLATEGALASADLRLEVGVTNTGDRAGKQVVQAYAERAGSDVERPIRWLIGSAAVELGAGKATTVRIPLGDRAFRHWVGGRDGRWAIEPGAFTVRVGTSVVDLPLSVELVPVPEEP